MVRGYGTLPYAAYVLLRTRATPDGLPVALRRWADRRRHRRRSHERRTTGR